MSGVDEKYYSVRGLKCGGCVAKATAALAPLPGYVSAEFNLKDGTAVVKGNVNPQAVIDSLNKVGYPTQIKTI